MKKLIFFVSLLMLFGTSFSMESVHLNPLASRSVTVNVLESYEDFTIVEVMLNRYMRGLVEIEDAEYLLLSLPSEAARVEQGNPDLPLAARALMIPAQAKMHVEILDATFHEITGQVAPSKGHFLRKVSPEDVPFEFSSVYQTDAFYPENVVELNDPFIMREVRGISFRVTPFAANPVQGIVRVYDRVVFKVYADGIDTIDILPANTSRVTKDFVETYTNNFINYNHMNSRNNFVEEQGSILVICFPAFMEAAQPYVDWKNQKGIKTVMVPSTVAGSTHTDIKTFITNYWADNPELAFVQLIGDGPQVPTHPWQSWSSDPTYVNILGSNHYTDLFIGRFSAETVAHVETQVTKSIWYERDIVEGAWLNNAMGLAGNEPGGHKNESDNQHMEIIRQLYLNSGTYSHVDAIYQPSANATQVSTALNSGRATVNYIAHGSVSGWHFLGSGGMDYTNNHVNALTNDWMLPHIVSVACDNGIFASGPACFAEVWLRATNSTTGAPTGAIATFMASMSQWWQPPMWGQDSISEFHVDEIYTTIGGLYFNGSADMLNVSTQQQYYETARTWHIFGDASLVVRSKEPVAMQVDAPDVFFMGMTSYEITVDTPGALVALYNPETKELICSVYANQNGIALLVLDEPFDMPADLLLTVTAYNKITQVIEVSVVPNDGAYIVYNTVEFSAGTAPDYGTSPIMNVTVFNVGSESAENVTATLVCDDSYVNITNGEANIANIPSNQLFDIGEFTFDVAHEVPDQHEAQFVLTVQNATGEWILNFKINLNAPIINPVAAFFVNETTGNDRLNPGETAELHIPFENTGGAMSSEGYIIAVSNHPEVTIEDNYAIISPVTAGGTSYAVFTVTADADMERGSKVRFGFYAEFSTGEFQSGYEFPIGLLIEDFESGDFTTFDWVNTSVNPWSATSDIVYEGSFSAESGDITHNQSSTLSITRELESAGIISFYYKVSSETNKDFLQFYLNNAILGQWSGEIDWTYVEFEIPAGTHQFRWIYRKDATGSEGMDKVWLDYIIFPLSGGSAYTGPIIFSSVDKFDFSLAEVGDVLSEDFTIVNFGEATLEGLISVPDGFTILPSEGAQSTMFTIPANSKSDFTLVFRPTEKIDYSGNVTIISNDTIRSEFLIEIKANLHVSDIDIPGLVTRLHGNFPNPFNPETTIRFSLGKDANVEISIYNIRGQLVKQLVNEEYAAGLHDIIWNGTDTHGRGVASGVYFYRFITPESSQVNRMILMK